MDKPQDFLFVPYRRDLIGLLAGDLASRLAKEDLVDYMQSCPVVLSARITTPDDIDSTGDPIPLIFFTDGSWIWNAEVVEYVKRYDMTVPPEFIEHVVRQNSNAPMVDEQRLEKALNLLGSGS